MLSGVKAAPVALAALLLVSGCGGSDTEASNGKPGTKKLPPTSAYDCTRAAAPERTNAVPIACATDRSCTTRLVSGHRGVGGDLGVLAPEDTVSAVFAAVAIGSDFVETDPRPTKDGVLVNLHDPDVDRTTNGSGNAADMTLAEIQGLQIDASKFAGDFSCEHVPTLEEILAAARGRIHVLIDANKTDRVDLLVKAIQDTDALDWAIFDTDSPDKISEALTLEPKLHTMIRVADTAELDSELQLFSAHPPVIVELHDGADVSQLVPAVHAAGNRALTDVFGLDLSAKFSNDSSLYEAVFADGVDIAQSDRPELVLEYLGR